MAQYLVRRIFSGLIAFLIFTVIVFFAFNLLAPYDYVTTVSLGLAGNEAREALRTELGLNLPLWQQYFHWISRIAQGNLGNEFTLFGQGRPVTEIFRESLPSTLLVFVTSAFLAFWIGVYLGKVTGWKPKKRTSQKTVRRFLNTLFKTFNTRDGPVVFKHMGYKFADEQEALAVARKTRRTNNARARVVEHNGFWYVFYAPNKYLPQFKGDGI